MVVKREDKETKYHHHYHSQKREVVLYISKDKTNLFKARAVQQPCDCNLKEDKEP